jgi:hypothetical protein
VVNRREVAGVPIRWKRDAVRWPTVVRRCLTDYRAISESGH